MNVGRCLMCEGWFHKESSDALVCKKCKNYNLSLPRDRAKVDLQVIYGKKKKPRPGEPGRGND